MNVSKINSTPAFRGTLIVPNDVPGAFKNYTIFYTEDIYKIRKYANGTKIMGYRQDCFVSNDKLSFQDIAAAYNMTKNDCITVDLTTSNMELKA